MSDILRQNHRIARCSSVLISSMNGSPVHKETIRRFMEKWGGRFSLALGIDIESGRPSEMFKWFLASILFGARIRQDAAMNTYREFARRDVLTPEAILKSGWNGLVEILDAGGYARYDFRTATKLLGLTEELQNRYGGDLNRLHEESRDSRDLELKLREFKGIGPVTVNIFLRELRGVWPKANPLPGNLVVTAARELGLLRREEEDERNGMEALRKLEGLWKRWSLPCRFSDFEAALVKFGIWQRRRHASVKLD